jgi:hypothetical protein
MRIHETFSVARPPEQVFAFMVEAENLAKWQTIKTRVTPLTDGPTRVGSRFREEAKAPVRAAGSRSWR